MMKNIGKPCTGKPYARFDEGGQDTVTTIKLVRHRQTKGAVTDRFGLRARDACFLLYLLFLTLFFQRTLPRTLLPPNLPTAINIVFHDISHFSKAFI